MNALFTAKNLADEQQKLLILAEEKKKREAARLLAEAERAKMQEKLAKLKAERKAAQEEIERKLREQEELDRLRKEIEIEEQLAAARKLAQIEREAAEALAKKQAGEIEAKKNAEAEILAKKLAEIAQKKKAAAEEAARLLAEEEALLYARERDERIQNRRRSSIAMEDERLRQMNELSKQESSDAEERTQNRKIAIKLIDSTKESIQHTISSQDQEDEQRREASRLLAKKMADNSQIELEKEVAAAAKKKLDDEAARLKAQLEEEEAKRLAFEAEEARKLEEKARILAEEEAKRKREEEEEARRLAEIEAENKRIAEELEEARRKAKEEEDARIRAEEMEARRLFEEFNAKNAELVAAKMALIASEMNKKPILAASNSTSPFIFASYTNAPLYFTSDWADHSFENKEYCPNKNSLIFINFTLKCNKEEPVVLISKDLVRQRNELSHFNFLAEGNLDRVVEKFEEIERLTRQAMSDAMEAEFQQFVLVDEIYDTMSIMSFSLDILELISSNNKDGYAVIESNSSKSLKDLFEPKLVLSIRVDENFMLEPVPAVDLSAHMELVRQRRLISDSLGYINKKNLIKNVKPESSHYPTSSVRLEFTEFGDTDLFVGVYDPIIDNFAYENEEIATNCVHYASSLQHYENQDSEFLNEYSHRETLEKKIVERGASINVATKQLEKANAELARIKIDSDKKKQELLVSIQNLENLPEYGILVEENARFIRDKYFLYFNGLNVFQLNASAANSVAAAKKLVEGKKPDFSLARVESKKDTKIMLFDSASSAVHKYLCSSTDQIEKVISHLYKCNDLRARRVSETRILDELEHNTGESIKSFKKNIENLSSQLQSDIASLDQLKKDFKYSNSRIDVISARLTSEIKDKETIHKIAGAKIIERTKFYEKIRGDTISAFDESASLHSARSGRNYEESTYNVLTEGKNWKIGSRI